MGEDTNTALTKCKDKNMEEALLVRLEDNQEVDVENGKESREEAIGMDWSGLITKVAPDFAKEKETNSAQVDDMKWPP